MKEKVLVLVRAIPEKSRKHGHISCVAGINEKGELRRLYPFKFSEMGFRKKQWIDVEVVKSENDKRNESFKVVNCSPVNSFIDDFGMARLLSGLATSVESLKASKSSLGVIKPDIVGIEIEIASTQFIDEQAYFRQWEAGKLALREKVKMPVEVRYLYKCSRPCSCAEKPHRQILIDWEVNELARNIMHGHSDKAAVKAKLQQKLFSWMRQRDVFFILGTHFKYGTWMIIGLYYFKPSLAAQKTLGQF